MSNLAIGPCKLDRQISKMRARSSNEAAGLRRDLDLTRLSGHFMFTKEGDQDGEVTAEIYTGVSPPDGGAAPDGTQV